MNGKRGGRVLMFALAVALAGCGETADGTGDGGPDAGGFGGAGGGGGGGAGGADAGGTPDSGGGSKKYKWIAIFDDDITPECNNTSGPGADIDAVDLRRGGAISVAGVGLKGSASFAASMDTTAAACTTCGAGMMTCMHSGMAVASRAEGAQDGESFADKPDVGYISLNGGVLWLQVGSVTGNAPVAELESGDVLRVYEIDKYYVEIGKAPMSCLCAPEKYTVYAYVEKGEVATRVKLVPTKYEDENAAMCGAPSSGVGCGTTEFSVP